MKTIVVIFGVLFFTLRLLGQDCYLQKNNEYLKTDYSHFWSDKTFQGTIGENNQRIEMRFLNVKRCKDSISSYSIVGKSRVKKNICDFKGFLKIDSILIHDFENVECEGADYPYGFIYGRYELKENPTQNHVGTFSGIFQVMFDYYSNGVEVTSGWYGQEGFDSFIGTWEDYHNDAIKYCSWGYFLPPSKYENLVRQYDNEVYLFNKEFLENGWKSYVISNLNYIFLLPKEFNTDSELYSNDLIEYSNEEIERNKEIEETEWWK